jgi:hypothetical protein
MKTGKKKPEADQSTGQAAINELVDQAPEVLDVVRNQDLVDKCSVCGKTKSALAIDGVPLMREGSVATCRNCKMQKKLEESKPAAQIPSRSPAPEPPADLMSEIRTKKAIIPQGNNVIDAALERDLDEIVIKQHKDLLTQYDAAVQSLGSFLSQSELSMIRSHVEFPPMCQRIMTTFKVIRSSIRMSHPASDALHIDINKNPEALDLDYIVPYLEMSDFSIKVERAPFLEYLITISIMVHEVLKEAIQTGGFFDRRAERWWGVVSKQLEELQTRVMSLTGAFLTFTGTPFEVNKLFASVYNALARLASIEQRLGKDVLSDIEKNWIKLKGDQ